MPVGDGTIGTPCKFRFANPVTGATLAPPPETVFVVAYISGQTRDQSAAYGDLIFQVIGVKGTPLLLATPVAMPLGRVRLDLATVGLTPIEPCMLLSSRKLGS